MRIGIKAFDDYSQTKLNCVKLLIQNYRINSRPDSLLHYISLETLLYISTDGQDQTNVAEEGGLSCFMIELSWFQDGTQISVD